jgi:type I restriction enzyme, R subunit
LRKIVELTRKLTSPEVSGAYPATMNTRGKRALYDNLRRDEELALAVDEAVRSSRQDDWRGNSFKVKKVRNAIRAVLEAFETQTGDDRDPAKAGGVLEAPVVWQPPESLDERVERILALVKNQDEY